ncbi:MAG: 16S rRNA (guanine(966)-N(2))-methyltransferase RsmD [Sulfurimonas sp. RIFOXYD12_FULL_33_39]|uniref:16S rRNA (guanine(966)-N(2))-methyltransferase RsmD n=1 Tax=unclassified Sulfurimonas TaxID=2623549 RepID=UPI0008CDF124|nr:MULTISPECIES: 16S rRNA (guanine(966)-N(2))-methyltransferase RsmD [unclassified Sulfurimonas]OHE01635.1 MAG: 16S rRNA (guanine(966)-N(2))-methyltransferase RsmD [Sulfurimonas sp. RIFCSPLOWO2_12_FULL_34_6]OHE10603.1 MAG: 16S rRNA (guanine(966)-N(2))-methyltransferase RsmD [Sulfurimonas sp. RIFOXYD12_FULL_33_39]OHE15062.1 MAG: 16S rRNA (guanine(966)-N(2))-methyltransferase RsmD [Sulfurimonas sp. RIFOXYD2_FULL_34_21]DAB27421.1 MAG TPA: 16S rRNA (guanine(966)-N(2))-methyltransferase RsmD [Sulfur
MKNKPITKKIISGKFKNKILKLPSKITTRTSKAIVLESFFNTIQFEIIDAIFVELFSGSGSIGLEALSRGAKKVIFMERDSDALKILKENIAQTDPEGCEIYGGDTFVNIKNVVKVLEKKNDNAYFYIDPPFNIREGMEDIYDKTIDLIASLPKECVKLIIIEHMSGLELPSKIGAFSIKKSKKFGNTTLTYFSGE